MSRHTVSGSVEWRQELFLYSIKNYETILFGFMKKSLPCTKSITATG